MARITLDNMKKKVFTKLFFPKVVVIDKPGIIYSFLDVKTSKARTKKRIVYLFEELVTDIQDDSIKLFGRDEAGRLWQKIGEEFATRLISFGKFKQPPKILVPAAIDNVFLGLCGAGMSAGKYVEYDRNKRRIVIHGTDNIFCRKNNLYEQLSGAVSILLGFVTGKKIKCDVMCSDCPNGCKYVFHISDEIFSLNDDKACHGIKYDAQNFMEQPKKGYVSFHNLVTHKKIKIDKNGKNLFEKQTMVPIEIGWLSIIVFNYKHKKKLLDLSLQNSARKIAHRVLHGKTKTHRYTELRSILSAFGFGRLSCSGQETLSATLSYAPYCSYSKDWLTPILHGLLEEIYGPLKIGKISERMSPYSISISFSPVT